MRGVSAEFEEYRLYRQGDDPRRIDWRLLARSDRAYVRLAADRAVLPTVLVVDGSASMAFPVESRAKWVQACQLAVGLAAVAHAEGDPVGLAVAAGGGLRQVAPRTRRGVVADLARMLDDAEPGGGASLAPALRAALASAGAWGRRARVVVVGDFLGDAEALLRLAAQHVAAGGEVHAVHVVAVEELSPPEGALLAVDPEDASVRRPLVDATRQAYRAAFGEWRGGLAGDWRGAGAGYTLVATDEAADRAIRRIVAPAADVAPPARLAGPR
jgi:uncharacterized protein (DUF58 family)